MSKQHAKDGWIKLVGWGGIRVSRLSVTGNKPVQPLIDPWKNITYVDGENVDVFIEWRLSFAASNRCRQSGKRTKNNKSRDVCNKKYSG